MKKQTIIALVAITLTASYLSLAHAWNLFGLSNDTTTVLPAPVPVAPVGDLPETPVKTSSSAVQVALLLDVSGSMSGLIEQAKSQLWKIMNELAILEKPDGEPDLEMALYVYGSTDNGREKNEILKLLDFTTDMDLFSQKLFELGTSGSSEYAGEVIGNSLKELEWRAGSDHLKVIYIAGNESFNQGRISYAQSCGEAVERSIVVNTIFCGDRNQGRKLDWEKGAIAGKGSYFHIDHNEKTVYIETPYDQQINQLNQQLNNTYIPYGAGGVRKKQQQELQDSNAGSYSASNMAERSKFKASKKYKAESWDLVDAYQKDKKIVEEKENLPDDLQHNSVAEIEAKIQQITNDRERIKKEINEKNKLRTDFITNATKEDANANSLEGSIIQSIDKIAKERGFTKSKE